MNVKLVSAGSVKGWHDCAGSKRPHTIEGPENAVPGQLHGTYCQVEPKGSFCRAGVLGGGSMLPFTNHQANVEVYKDRPRWQIYSHKQTVLFCLSL